MRFTIKNVSPWLPAPSFGVMAETVTLVLSQAPGGVTAPGKSGFWSNAALVFLAPGVWLGRKFGPVGEVFSLPLALVAGALSYAAIFRALFIPSRWFAHKHRCSDARASINR